MRKADNWNDKSRQNAGICIHYGLLAVSKWAWSTRRGSFICSLSNFLLLRLGVWISDVSAPLVSPQGHHPVTQFERHLTGNEIRQGERAWRADRKEQVENKAVCVLQFYPLAIHTDSLFFFPGKGFSKKPPPQKKKHRVEQGKSNKHWKTTTDNMMVVHR